MANADIEGRFTDRRFIQGSSTKPGTTGSVDYSDVGSMRTFLAGFQPATFTSRYLDIMSKNDMVMAVRQAKDAAGIK